MKHFHVSYFDNKRAQLKIQQMAFVLVALIIFLAIVALFYFSISLSNLRKTAASLQDEEAKEIIRKLASTPEFVLTTFTCSNCIDLDKTFSLKERRSYDGFWNLGFLQIEKVYPEEKNECDKANYPNCRTITLIKNEEIGSPKRAFVTICYWTKEKGGYTKCELGRIYASGKGIEK